MCHEVESRQDLTSGAISRQIQKYCMTGVPRLTRFLLLMRCLLPEVRATSVADSEGQKCISVVDRTWRALVLEESLT